MTLKYPYASSGHIVQIVEQLRKKFPPTVNAETLKIFKIAPNNEAYVLNVLKFVGVINEDGSKTNEAAAVFTKHEDSDFQSAFAGLIKKAYDDLFAHYDDAWTQDKTKLISYFRSVDQTSDVVGNRQAGTFQTLATLSGYGETPQPPKKVSAKTVEKTRKPKSIAQAALPQPQTPQSQNSTFIDTPKNRDIGLTVRIEINLPAIDDQEIYDKIFRSIRENLIDGEQ